MKGGKKRFTFSGREVISRSFFDIQKDYVYKSKVADF